MISVKTISANVDHGFFAEAEGITLRPLRHEDIERLRCWRNDRSNTRYLRDIGYIERDSQEGWYRAYLGDQDICIFAIVDEDIVKGIVGSVAIYDFNGEEAEVGKILIGDDRAHGRGMGRKAMVLAMMVGFRKLNIRRFHAFVEPENIAAFRTYMDIGFSIEERHITESGREECRIVCTEESILKSGYNIGKTTVGDEGEGPPL